MTIYPSKFDVTVTALTTIAHMAHLDSGDSPIAQTVVGMEAFVIANILDRVFCSLIPRQPILSISSLANVIQAPLLEELFYSIILRTDSLKWAILRLPASIIVGMGAARALGASSKTDGIPGLIFAILRETVLQTTPSAIPLLAVVDSIIFALNEVGSMQVLTVTKKGITSSQPRWGREWFCKLFSSFAFRGISHLSISWGGPIAPFIQHFLFNLSRLMEKSAPIKI